MLTSSSQLINDLVKILRILVSTLLRGQKESRAIQPERELEVSVAMGKMR